MLHICRRAPVATLIALVLLCSPAPLLAKAPSTDAYARFADIEPPAWSGDSLGGRVAQGLMWSGAILEAADQPRAAASVYMQAAAWMPEIADFLRLKAAQVVLTETTPWTSALRRIAATGALERPIAGRALLQARAWRALHDALPPLPVVRRALNDSSVRPQTCTWLTDMIDPAPSPTPWATLIRGRSDEEVTYLIDIAQLLHARCGETAATSWADAREAPVAAPSRLQRAEFLYQNVRFYWTLAELDAVAMDDLDATQTCRAIFRRGRASYRIRKLRDESDAHYQQVVAQCTAPDQAGMRISALYALGKRAFERDRWSLARASFERILQDYPTRSHADDALLYLARIAREQGDSAREATLLATAVSTYPDGDMVHELAWEVLEETYRAGTYALFLKKIDALALPEHDDQYFSQGRLRYFAAKAQAALGRKDAALATWLATWQRYPFSFYGYVSLLELQRRKVASGDLAIAPGWEGATAEFFGDAWRASPSAMLAEVGLWRWAAQVEAQRLAALPSTTPRDLWRLAYLRHRAGQYHISHNIVRRRIAGRPWADPEDARALRWVLAWPAPYRTLVEESVRAEQAQYDDSVRLRPFLPMAIMREESSFIPDIESYAGALGLMQLMPATARGHDGDIDGAATPEKLKTPEVNVRVAADHLFMLARRFENHPVLMTAAYNAGSGAVGRWLRRPRSRDIALWVEDIPYLQARSYTKRVIGSYLAYQWMTGASTFDATVLQSAEK